MLRKFRKIIGCPRILGDENITHFYCFQSGSILHLVEDRRTYVDGEVYFSSSENTYDFSTGELKENIIGLNQEDFSYDLNHSCDDAKTQILTFASLVFMSNKYARAAVEDADMPNEDDYFGLRQNIGKMYYLMVHNQGLLESLIKTGIEALRNLDSMDVRCTSLRKAQPFSVGVMDFINKVDSSLCNICAENLSNDDMEIIISFCKAPFLRTKENKRSFIENMANLMKVVSFDDKIRVVDVLRYLARETYLHAVFTQRGFQKTMHFFKDYCNMRSQVGMDVERYPNDIFKSHEILSNNIKLLSFKNVPEFISAVSEYARQLEREFEVDGERYVVIAPKSVEDLFEEGAQLHHCVGSYASLIANRETQVVFLRKAEEVTIPWITIEVQNHKVVQACKIYNAPATEEEKIIRAYERRI